MTETNSKSSILIVDDEPLNLTALSQILSADYTLFIEKDGQGCIDTARELRPDLILLDVMMPAMTGFEAITHLKKDEATKEIPVIFVTGLGNAQDEEKGFCLGAADYINKPFSSAIVKLRVRNQLQIINQIRQIRRLSVTDSLTEIHNRRYFNDVVSQEWNRAIRYSAPLSFILFDIDAFKEYNEKYGHIQGDIVLKGIAGIINNRMRRAADQAARWGGEEFAVLLPDTDLSGARTVAEDLSRLIEEAKFMTPDGNITHITVSAGVNSVTPVRNEYSLSNFITDADKALNRAKSLGQSKVCTLEDA